MERRSFGIYEDQFTGSEVEEFIRSLGGEQPIRGGKRNLLDSPEVVPIIRSAPVRSLVEKFLSAEAVCVRGILFDKTQESNWNLPFHQDTKIGVKRSVNAPGYAQFSEKDGVVHCCPPAEVLERQIALRIQLDACPSEAGPVRVIEGSDASGLLNQDEITEMVSTSQPVACTGGVGSILVFRSLVLHGSDRSTSLSRRRVLHLEFCDAKLETPVEWKWAISLA
jgi:ectoine hydroxylase-related dioxygenase (phytanoyl-CoA dioxygenase family)